MLMLNVNAGIILFYQCVLLKVKDTCPFIKFVWVHFQEAWWFLKTDGAVYQTS